MKTKCKTTKVNMTMGVCKDARFRSKLWFNHKYLFLAKTPRTQCRDEACLVSTNKNPLRALREIFLINLYNYVLIRKPAVSLLFLLIACLSFAQFDEGFEDKTESPFFIVKGDGKNHIELPLRHTEVEVNIAGMIADVKVKQLYVNSGDVPIEAVYVFPGSSKSAVYGMQMVIGDKVIKAKIKEREQAKKEYETAKKEGKAASLLEQHRPNVFQMNVANILPGDAIEVELKYTEILVPEDGTYEFVYPTVVGPRYADSAGVIKDPWVLNPHVNPKIYDATFSGHTFNIIVNLSTGIPINDARSTSHKVSIDYQSATQASFKLKNPDSYEGDRDFILKYRLTGNGIESGLSLFEGEEENFFLMMVQPPERVLPEQIPPREYIFIVDVSGSMNGFPIDISKTLMRNLLKNLRPEDKFNVMLFAAASAVLNESSAPATKSNIKEAIRFIDSQEGSGSTELLPALKRALALPGSDDYSRTVVIVTDGYVTVEKEAFDLIRKNLGTANFFPFGIGTSVNRYIIEGIARAGQGEPLIITNKSEAKEKAEKFRQYIQSPVLTNIAIEFAGFDVYDVEPLSFPDLFAERPIVIFGKWKNKPKGKIKVRGVSGTKKYTKDINLSDYDPTDKNAALRYLWARNRIMTLSDYNELAHNKALVKEITELGLKYNLLTEYTSFVGIDDETLTNNISGQSSGSVPEPHEWALIMLMALALSWFYFYGFLRS